MHNQISKTKYINKLANIQTFRVLYASPNPLINPIDVFHWTLYRHIDIKMNLYSQDTIEGQ